MAKSSKKGSYSQGNVTKEKLAGTPFKTAAEINDAREEILRETWQQMERARATKDLLKKDEYEFFTETFKKGLLCKYGESKGNLVRVFLGDNGIQIAIDEEMKTDENSELLLSSLIKSLSEAFMANYLRAMSIIPTSESINLSQSSQQSPLKRSAKK